MVKSEVEVIFSLSIDPSIKAQSNADKKLKNYP